MSVITDIADAVVTSLNGGAFSLPFKSTRAYVPITELKNLKSLTVFVVPKDQEITLLDRKKTDHEIRLDIGIHQKVSSSDNSELDPLFALVDEIIDFITDTRVFGDGIWLETENNPIYSPDHLIEMRVFTSLITITLKYVKS